jgi:cyclopropane-fatty-acyl-phospholipid synthase
MNCRRCSGPRRGERGEHDEQFDAIVLNGVIEELRDFPAVMERLARWVKPGKRVYIDFMAATEHSRFPAFISKYV